MRGFAGSIGVLLLAGLETGAAAPPSPASPVPVERRVLSGGSILLYANDDSSRVTSVEIFVRGGKSVVPLGKEGLASLTTRLALEITDARKAQDMMGQATRLGAVTLDDFSLVALECLSENVEQALKATADMVLDPLFSGLRIDALRDFLSHQSRIEEDDAAAFGHRVALQTLFAGTGYGASAHGTPESLKALTKKDIQAFYESSFRAGNLIFSVVSDLDPERVRTLLENSFGRLKPSASPEGGPSPPQPAAPSSREARTAKDTRQTYVALAFPLPPLDEKTYLLAVAFENLLGKGPGSRLWPLRSELRLGYDVNARAMPMRIGGVLEAYLITDSARAEEALAALRGVFEGLVRDGLAPDELRVTKACLRTQFLRDNEMKTSRARTIGSLEALGLGSGLFDRFPAAVEALTAEDMTVYLRSVLDPAKALTVVVGPGADRPK